MNTIPFTKLRNTKAWKLTSLFVRTIAKGICYTCGNRFPIKKLVAGHFREKMGNAGVYFDLDNLRAQCQWYCNRMGHGMKDIYAKKLREEIGEERFSALFKKSVQGKKWTKKELKEIEKQMEAKLTELQSRQ